VDEEHKVAGAPEGLSASAFLARYRSFRYIETRSGMKMSDKQAIVGGRAIVGKNPSVPQLSSINRANESPSLYEIRRPERAISNIKSPNPVIKTRSNSMKTNDGDMLKSPKNQEMRFAHALCFHRFFAEHPPDFLAMDNGLRQGIALAVPNSAQGSGVSTPEVRELNGAAEYGADHSHFSALLTGSAPQTEFDVTYRKQTTAHFLTGSRIAQLDPRICAKMSAQTSSKLSPQMSEIR
jgi:hypothetical protein